jgi:hypothetical protein
MLVRTRVRALHGKRDVQHRAFKTFVIVVEKRRRMLLHISNVFSVMLGLLSRVRDAGR